MFNSCDNAIALGSLGWVGLNSPHDMHAFGHSICVPPAVDPRHHQIPLDPVMLYSTLTKSRTMRSSPFHHPSHAKQTETQAPDPPPHPSTILYYSLILFPCSLPSSPPSLVPLPSPDPAREKKNSRKLLTARRPCSSCSCSSPRPAPWSGPAAAAWPPRPPPAGPSGPP